LMKTKRFYDSFYKILDTENELIDFQEFLNTMGIKCELLLKPLPDGQKELYFKHKRLVPFFETASSGTLSLIELYRRILIGRKSSILYMDEFDAFYHYEMAENVIRFFKMKYPECQIIMTTHNTNLMTNRIMRPDCLFILSQKGTITALCDSTERELREGHNLEKMYISGEFEKYE
ncbi:MAG: AAA family ATPase, partial [Lachnospiraceae bacterium]